jgi:uncharacterized SAM-binding protein YcdF (DUF218 family)
MTLLLARLLARLLVTLLVLLLALLLALVITLLTLLRPRQRRALHGCEDPSAWGVYICGGGGGYDNPVRKM